MKQISLFSLSLVLVAPLLSLGQTVVFQDTFQAGSLSTLNPTATSPGTLTGARTAYEIASSKSATATAVAAGSLTLATASTSSGYTESQALFTNSPVTLNAAGQFIEVYYTFTDTTSMFNTSPAGNNMQINIGLYNSGGSAPTNGTLLWNSGLASGSTTAVNGGTKGWVGYTGQFAYTPTGSGANSSAIATRPAQTGANNLNQGVGTGSGYTSGANITSMAGVVGQPLLTVGTQYTMHMRITYVNATTLAVTNTLYNGVGTGGAIFSAGGWTGRLGIQTTSIMATSFDALEIGYRPTTSTATTLQINKVTVAFYDPNAAAAPTITGLTNRTVEAGTTVVLNPTVSGTPLPTYQWKSNAVEMVGQTNASLTLASVTTNQSGYIYSLTASNSQGVVTSNMTLTVTEPVFSDMTVTGTIPANNATGIFLDAPMTITFSSVAKLGSTGSIKIYNAANPAVPVDTISAASGLIQQRTFPGDSQSFSYTTFITNGSTVTFYPHFNALASNQTYFVTIDPGTFTDVGNTNFIGYLNTNAWRFTTKTLGAVNPTNIVVAGDSSGDFLTVQGAVNFVPSGNTTPRVISIRNGDYDEIVNISGKHSVTFRGQSRTGVRVGYANNATFQTANSGSTHARMAFKVGANDIAFDNLTITNRTPQGGSQAEALMVETGAARCVANNSDIASRQDTILVNSLSSQLYCYNSTIRGNFDFIWGGGNMYFDKCSIVNISGTGSGNITAARTATNTTSATYPWLNPSGTYTANGVSFVDCTFTADAGVTGITLAGSNGTAGNNASWARCKFASTYVTPSASLFSGNFVFWQYQNTDLAGTTPVTFSALTTLSGADARLLAATNITTWFYGWTPQLTPNILTNPVGSYLAPAGTVTLTVAATGVPEPKYQWLKNGTNVPGAISAILSIPGAVADDSGTYSVIVSNIAGTVTSSTAIVTVNTAPVATNDTATVQHGQTTTIPVAKLLGNDSDADGDLLSITAVSANASLGGGLVTYTAPASGSSAIITYALSDGRGGTNVGTINVTLTSSGGSYNQLAATILGGGDLELAYLGIPGTNYALDVTHDLTPPVAWTPVKTNPAAPNGYIFFTNTPSLMPTNDFYRTRVP